MVKEKLSDMTSHWRPIAKEQVSSLDIWQKAVQALEQFATVVEAKLIKHKKDIISE